MRNIDIDADATMDIGRRGVLAYSGMKVDRDGNAVARFTSAHGPVRSVEVAVDGPELARLATDADYVTDVSLRSRQMTLRLEGDALPGMEE